MTDIPNNFILAQAKNAVVTPLYFDRQVIQAEDLNLDRTSHDRELARMRRILHGWGVVAGLIPEISRKSTTALEKEQKDRLTVLEREIQTIVAALKSEDKGRRAVFESENKDRLTALEREKQIIVAASESEDKGRRAAFESENKDRLTALEREIQTIVAALKSEDKGRLTTFERASKGRLAALEKEKKAILVALEREGKNILIISAGYGITQAGDEVYLSKELRVEDIACCVRRCSQTAQNLCEDIKPEEQYATHATHGSHQDETVSAWLIARPTQTAAVPRPSIAEGCAHPANNLLPSRACDGVSIELLCGELPDGFVSSMRECEELQGFFGNEPVNMLPMPWEKDANGNFLVLGQITLGPNGVHFSAKARRAVLPLSLLQDWLQACQCCVQVEKDPQPDKPTPEDDAIVSWTQVPDLTLISVADRLVENGFQVIDTQRPPPEKIDLRPAVPEVLTNPDILRRMERAGITTVGQLFATDHQQLATTLDLAVSEVDILMSELKPLGALVTRGGF